MDTHTPKHRAALREPFPGWSGNWYDCRSLADDPPPVHPSGIVAGGHRLTDREALLRLWDRTSESGSTTLAAATGIWMVAGLLGLLAGFMHLAGCAA